jgi:hypothetical protein
MNNDEIKQWLDYNSHKGKLADYHAMSSNPDNGEYIQLDDLDIPKDVFPEEFKQLERIKHNILKKLEYHYDNNLKD